MLPDLQKLREKKKSKVTTAAGSVTDYQKPQLDDALELLEDKKRNETKNDFSSSHGTPSSRGIDPQSRVRSGNRVTPRSFSDPETGRSAEDSYAVSSGCADLCSSLGMAVHYGDEAFRGAGFQPPGGDPVGKFIGGGHIFMKHALNPKTRKNVKGAAIGANLFMGLLTYGLAAEIYMDCCQSGEDLGHADVKKLLDDARKKMEGMAKENYEEMNRNEKNDPGNFSLPVCAEALFVKYCVSKGDQGSRKFMLASSSNKLEFTLHPHDIFKFGIKVLRGPRFKEDMPGGASAEGAVGSYMDCTLGGGCTAGVEAEVSASGGKYVTMKYGKKVSLLKTSFQNHPGTSGKP
jgi:hypothetical protein